MHRRRQIQDLLGGEECIRNTAEGTATVVGAPRTEPIEDISRGSWGNTGKEHCNSRGFAAGSRLASGHRHRASLDRRSRVLQKKGCQVQNERGKIVPTNADLFKVVSEDGF